MSFSRQMPIPTANDPKGRGSRRSQNIDVDSTALATGEELKGSRGSKTVDAEPATNDNDKDGKNENQPDSDEEAKFNFQTLLREIPRDNPNDPFKPHSVKAIHELAEGSPGQLGQPPLLPQEEELLQHYGHDLDQCTQFDQPIPSMTKPEVPDEAQYELNRFPAWLRTFLEVKYPQIHAKYGKENAPIFLKQLAARFDYQKCKHTQLAGDPKDGENEDFSNYIADEQDYYDEQDEYVFIGDGEDKEELELQRQNRAVAVELDPFRETVDPKLKVEQKNVFKGKEIERVHLEITKDQGRHLEQWSPILIQKAGDSLRAALVAGASETEDEDYYEEGGDELIRQKELKKGLVRHKDQEFVYRGAHWEAIVAERSGFKEDAKEIMNEEFMRPDLLKQHRRKKRLEGIEYRKKERRAKKEIRKALRRKDYAHPLLKQSGDIQQQAATYRERGVGKRPSRLFTKSPADGPIVEVERNLHQTRSLEAMRAYANWIAASTSFKYFIMIIIIGNAILLAFETGESRNTYSTAFDILDSFFLSIYLAEFLLKFFAYPNQYFLSGFNIFDFVILVVSLIKAIADWADYAHLEYLRFLTIIRALRILRGVSLSIHIQVLVRALLDTLKNHVLNVVLLLILLMYILSIVAYYLYGDISGLDGMFGSFDKAMLRLFAFVTMDGWTYIMDRFEDVGKLHEGRLFCLIMCVLGNFIFANIFIAIIIMQISDATDTFRRIRADERDIRVNLKQDEIFRRQKLDMRQLLARQRLGVVDDFYELGSRFVKKLRHDDLVDNQNVLFSPLWMDSLYKGMQRLHHTSNVIMNQHRKMADRLVTLGNLYDEDKLNIRKISRARYNRYYEIKAKLRLIKEEFLLMRNVEPHPPKTKIKYKTASGFGNDESEFKTTKFASARRFR